MTIKEFMETYKGFDWKNGTIILVKGATPIICTGSWTLVLQKHINCIVQGWTHNANIMVLTIKK